MFHHPTLATNLSLGTVVIAATVLIHTTGLIALTRFTGQATNWLKLHHHTFGRVLAIEATVLGLFFIHTLEVWLWALVYLALGVVAHIEEALYFSTVSFSTIGFGDVVLSPEWRMFSSLEGINGFLLIGWSTAYLVAASTRHGPFRLGEHF